MRLFLVLSFLFFSVASHAESLTLKKALELALKRNPDYRTALLAVREASELEKERKSAHLFSIDFSYSYTRLNEEQKVKTEKVVIPPLVPGMSPLVVDPGDIVTSRQNVYKYAFTFYQPLFTGGKITGAWRLAKLGVDVERLKEQEARLDLVFQVKRAYFQALKARKFLEVARETVRLLERHFEDAKAFYQQGITPRVDLLRAEVALSQAKQNLTEARANYQVALGALAILLREPVDREFQLEDTEDVPVLGLSFRDCLREALSKRPVVKAVEKRVLMAREGVKIAKADYLPQVYLFGEYSKHGDTPDCTGDGLTDAERWAVGATLKWNLFEWGRTRARVKRASIEVLRALELEKSVKDKVSLEVREAYLKLKSAFERLSVARLQVKQAMENYRDTRQRYKEQIDTTTDVIDAQVFLTRAKNQYYAALYDYNIAYARLVRVMGGER